MKGESLEKVMEMAKKARDEASLMLAKEQATQQEIQNQINLLEDYKKSYSNKLVDTMRSPTYTPILMDYQRFLVSLDNTIAQAIEQLDVQEVNVNRIKDHWREKQKKLSSYETLDKRRKEDEKIKQNKNEMKISDEINNNKSARKSR